jgi:hypothetical protein
MNSVGLIYFNSPNINIINSNNVNYFLKDNY